MSSVAPPTDARVAFLASLIDDAALFPPAREPMAAAVSGHLRHRRGQHGWLQGRFLCPASRLAELAGSLTAHGDEAGFPWPVGAILDGAGRAPSWQAGVEADLVAVERMTGLSHGRARVEAVEVRLPDADPGAV
nr:hypothetical protein [Euzebyales bacterium]